MKRKYGFIKIRTKHTIIDQIIRILERTFPAYEIDIIDIKVLLRRNFHIILANIYWMIRIYGLDSFANGKNVFYNRFFGTPFMYRQIKKLLYKQIPPGKYAFTIQDCSLFDGSINNIPHFVYTDHTVLANKAYLDFNPQLDILNEEWMCLERQIYRNASMVFTRSKSVMRSVIKDYSIEPARVKAIYYAPYIEQSSAVHNREKYANKTVLFVGIEWERKGGPQLLEAFERVLEKLPTAQLIIVGCCPNVLLRNVEVLGMVPSDEVSACYERASVFCLPTRKEPFGIAFVEAMNHCLPLVGTRTGAIPEFIDDGKNGYLVDVGDTVNLSRKLVDLLENPEKCEAFGRKSGDVYNKRYTSESVSHNLQRYITPYLE